MAPVSRGLSPTEPAADFERAVQHRPDFADGGGDFLVILHQPRHSHKRLRHALAQHHEGEQ